MPNTYTQLYIQFVFAVKHRQALIQPTWETGLYKYISGIVQAKKSKMLAINGTADHIHIFIGYNPVISIPDLVKNIKLASNNWVNTSKLTKQRFGWQESYDAFSYSHSQVHDVCNYIENQKIHHKKKTFREEYMAFLQAFSVEYNEQYLFEFFDDVRSTPTELIKTFQ